MSILYDKMWSRLSAAGWTTYNNRKSRVLSERTITAIKNGTGGIDARTINKLCAYLNCQPGDLMEYVPDPSESAEQPAEKITEQQP